MNLRQRLRRLERTCTSVERPGVVVIPADIAAAEYERWIQAAAEHPDRPFIVAPAKADPINGGSSHDIP